MGAAVSPLGDRGVTTDKIMTELPGPHCRAVFLRLNVDRCPPPVRFDSMEHEVRAGMSGDSRVLRDKRKTSDPNRRSGVTFDFDAVLKKHGDSVFNALFRLTGDFHLSEDLFQETFIKVFKAMSGFDGRAKISTWLYSIALNTLRDHKRRKAVPTHGLPDDDKLRARVPSPDESLIRAEEMNALQRELRKLKESVRIPLVLHYIEGMSVQEIAGITERTQSDIKVSLHRGRETLKKRMRREA
jgi:RNA polymerase sigma-70 factor (ECF subfamily)